jgi:hypothetical protein
MAVTPADAAELLTLAASFDRRSIGEADALAWADALGDLDRAECTDAIRAHYRESTDWLMPAHIRERVKARRAAEHERRHSLMLRDELAIEARTHDPEASRRGYQLAMQTLAETRGYDQAKVEALDAQRAAQALPCPWCKASAGMPCRNFDRQARQPHPTRMEAAAKQAAA